MMEEPEMDDLNLMVEAKKRIAEDGPTISYEDVLSKNGMTEADLKGWEDTEIE